MSLKKTGLRILLYLTLQFVVPVDLFRFPSDHYCLAGPRGLGEAHDALSIFLRAYEGNRAGSRKRGLTEADFFHAALTVYFLHISIFFITVR